MHAFHVKDLHQLSEKFDFQCGKPFKKWLETFPRKPVSSFKYDPIKYVYVLILIFLKKIGPYAGRNLKPESKPS